MRPFAALLSVISATAAPAQLVINEVLFDPVGADIGAEIVEIKNVSGAPFDPAGWFLCVPFRYDALAGITIPTDGVVRLHLGATGTNTATDHFLPAFANAPARELDNIGDEILLYRSSLFFLETEIVDFVKWGQSLPLRAPQAVAIGQWPGSIDTVNGPFLEGESIAYTGSGDGPASWFRDETPTIGGMNGADVQIPFGVGCATSAGVPLILVPSPGLDGNRDFRIELAGGAPNALAGVQIGSPSGGLPVLGCSFEVLSFVTIGTQLDAAGNSRLAIPLTGPGVIGANFAFQGLVIDLLAPNSLFGATGAIDIVFGG